MVKTDLHEICRSHKLTNFINMEHGALVLMVVIIFDEGIDELEWRELRSCGIPKELAGDTELTAQLKVLCGKIGQ